MRKALHVPCRYQLTKDALRILESGHPWIFRSHVSSAIEAFPSGQWLALVDGSNRRVGTGIYEVDGVTAIRVLRRGPAEVDATFILGLVRAALAKRAQLRNYTEGFRAVHGENDGIPGVVIDVYGSVAVLQTYVPSVDQLGRLTAYLLCRELPITSLIWKLPAKRKRQSSSPLRLLRGAPPGIVRFREGKMQLAVDVMEGQKSGSFLDLRALRKWVSLQPLQNKRVLNLFCYSGMLAAAAELAGAREIWNVDVSGGALAFAKKHHARTDKHRFIEADIFDWVKNIPEREQFDLIICDPPMLASQTIQVPKALAAYRSLHHYLLPHLRPGGTLVTACCTSRVSRREFEAEADKMKSKGLKRIASLSEEDDHRSSFREGDYLKILVYRS